MLGSLRIGRLFGIQIRCSWTFLLLLPLFLQVLGSNLLASALLLLALFTAVLLHELGHALVARHLGIQVLDITFWPLGGMARMSEIPERPRIEGAIALAGPAVNGFLAVLAGLVGLIATLASPAGGTIAMGAFGFASINLVLGLFNLLPAFPMDGGRVLRAWYARNRSWVEATERAVRVGRWVAMGMVALAFFVPGYLFVTFLIAGFVWLTGGRELIAVRMRHGMNPFGGDGPGGVLFQRRGAQARQAEWAARSAPHVDPPDSRAGEGGAERPGAWGERQVGQGFSEDDVRAMERYHGRLPRE